MGHQRLSFSAVIVLLAGSAWCNEPVTLRHAVQGADSIVLARATERSKGKDDWYNDGEYEICEFEVLRVLHGSCGPRVRLVAHNSTGKLLNYSPGKTYYLCLNSAWGENHKGAYYDGTDFLTGSIPTTFELAGTRVTVAKDAIPPAVASQLDPPTAAAFEDVIRWLRGLLLRAAPARQFRCCERLAFDVTFTNPSTFPMRLALPRAGECGALSVEAMADEGGHALLIEDPPMPPLSHARVERLGPHASLTVRLAVPAPPLVYYRQDPARASTVALMYRAPFFESAVAPHRWFGKVSVTSPVRMTCPHRAWADAMARPSGPWDMTISGHTVTTPRQGLWPRVRLVRAGKADPRDYSEAKTLLLTGEETAALAGCFRIEREGRRLAGPAPRPAVVVACLERLPKDDYMLRIGLGGHFDLSRPGRYRVRCVLPGADPPSESNALDVTVLAPVRGERGRMP